MRKNLRLVVALVVGIPLLLAAALFSLVDAKKFLPVLTQQLSTSLRRQVTVQDLDLKWLPFGFAAKSLTIADDPRFSKQPFLQAESLEVQPALLPLLAGNLEVRSIRVLSPKIELIQDAAGKWNFDSLGSEEKGGSDLKLAYLGLEKATLGLTRGGEPRQQYSNLSGEVRDYAANQPFGLRLAATMDNGKAISIDGRITQGATSTKLEQMKLSFASLEGTLDGEVGAKALNLDLKIPRSPVAGAAPLFLPAGMNVDGQVSAAMRITGTASAPQLNGNALLEGFSVSGGEIRQPVKTAKLALRLSPQRIELEPASISSGNTNLQAFGVISNYQQAPKIEATLLAPQAKLPELFAIARAYGISAVDGIMATGDASLRIRAHGELSKPLGFEGAGSLRGATVKLPSLTKPLEVTSTDFRFEANSASLTGINAKAGNTAIEGDCRVNGFAHPAIDFNLKANRIDLDELRSLFVESKESSSPTKMTARGNIAVGSLQLAELVLTQLTAQADYNNGHLELNPLNAQIFGGRHTGSMEIDMRPAKPVYSMRSKLEQIESSQLLAAIAPMKGIISGPLTANLDLNFSPGDPAAIARSLTGKVALNFSQGKIASFNLTRELSTLARFLGSDGDTSRLTQFLGLTGDLELQSGLARTSNLKLSLSNLTASLTGSMNLADQTLDLKLLSILDKRFSEQVGGNKIGGFMTAALANSSGNLLIPATIKGTFAKPVMAPDPGEIARLKVQSFNPKDPKQMMESVGSVLDMFKPKKK